MGLTCKKYCKRGETSGSNSMQNMFFIACEILIFKFEFSFCFRFYYQHENYGDFFFLFRKEKLHDLCISAILVFASSYGRFYMIKRNFWRGKQLNWMNFRFPSLQFQSAAIIVHNEKKNLLFATRYRKRNKQLIR